MKSPTVSVNMTAYNTERYIAEAVESILAQSFRDFEFIIIDDGSTDRTRDLLERYAKQDGRDPIGQPTQYRDRRARNEALGLSRGEFIAVMDSDDVALPERLEHQLAFLAEHPECVMVGSRVQIIDPDGSPLTVMGQALTHEEIDASFMAGRGQMVYHPSVTFRRQPLLEVGPYRHEYEPAEDLDIFLRLAEVGRIVNLAEPLLRYREHLRKAGHVRGAKQADAIYHALEAAYRRRGLEMPEEVGAAVRSRLPSATARRRVWGWWALSQGYAATARKHAIACLVSEPFSMHSWRLLYCALRGR